MRDYTKIQARRLADDLTVAVYETCRSFPREELYGLTSQLRRAASSVPANIAEGSARESKRDYLHFLYFSRGSLTETQYFLHLAARLSYLNAADHQRLAAQTKTAFACLHGLIKAVEAESGRLTKAIAVLSSAFALFLVRAFPGPSSVVRGL